MNSIRGSILVFAALLVFFHISATTVRGGCPFALPRAASSLQANVSIREVEKRKSTLGRIKNGPRFWNTKNCERKILRKKCRKIIRARRGAYVGDLVRAVFHDHQACALDGSLRWELHRPENYGLERVTEMVERAARRSKCSVADAFALCAIKAIRYTGGPRIRMKWGHIDAERANPEGHMPPGFFNNGQNGAFTLRNMLYKYDDDEIVLLSSAHNIGHFHLRDSNGDVFGVRPFTTDEMHFTNEYFKNLLHVHQHGYAPTGTYQLPSDLVLIEDAIFRKYVVRYANNQSLYFQKFRQLMYRMIGEANNCDPSCPL